MRTSSYVFHKFCDNNVGFIVAINIGCSNRRPCGIRASGINILRSKYITFTYFETKNCLRHLFNYMGLTSLAGYPDPFLMCPVYGI